MAETQIEWTDATWNPIAGCSIITAGCTHCYAMEMAKRLEAMGVKKYAGLNAPSRRPDRLERRRERIPRRARAASRMEEATQNFCQFDERSLS